ncbi:family 20 glycosylhydrolase [Streptomyces sioyaensis]|uniref:family 20 glycosylhydrolase n=1 Tax=Streptomyces sioyaensis TaxID=67364 RepID=UPI00378894A6
MAAVVLGMAIAVGAAGFVAATPAAPPGPALNVLPGVQRWTPAGGSFRYRPGSRVVVDDASLASTARTFAEDLRVLTGTRPQVRRGPAREGDIVLRTGGSGAKERYELQVAGTLQVRAATDTGAFNGTRTLLQLLRSSRTIPAGQVEDWPRKPVRGVMVDNGRKFFTRGWIERQIRNMAYLKLNYLHLHLSDNDGFRIQSVKHPEIVSRDALSKDDVRHILGVAAKYHVTVVPEIDMPGHMKQAISKHPELALQGSDNTVDLTKPATYAFLKDLLDEYLPLFPGPYWHIGADETASVRNNKAYIDYAKKHFLPPEADPSKVTGDDTTYGFLNWARGIVVRHGKQARVWNDAITGIQNAVVVPEKDIVVDFWTARGADPNYLLDHGYAVTNSGSPPTYYATGGAWGYRKDTQWTYENWDVDNFLKWGGPKGDWDISPFETASKPAANQGTALHIWTDKPDAETEDHIAEHTAPLERVIAQAAWGSPRVVPTFSRFTDLVNTVGDAPEGDPTTNLARLRPAAGAGDTPKGAVDDDPNTGWQSGPGSLTVDLGSPHTVSRVVAQWGAGYASRYHVDVSPDGTTWTTIGTRTDGKGGAIPYRKVTPNSDLTAFDPTEMGTEELEHLTGKGRYVRIVLDTVDKPEGATLVQFRVFGAAA